MDLVDDNHNNNNNDENNNDQSAVDYGRLVLGQM